MQTQFVFASLLGTLYLELESGGEISQWFPGSLVGWVKCGGQTSHPPGCGNHWDSKFILLIFCLFASSLHLSEFSVRQFEQRSFAPNISVLHNCRVSTGGVRAVRLPRPELTSTMFSSTLLKHWKQTVCSLCRVCNCSPKALPYSVSDTHWLFTQWEPFFFFFWNTGQCTKSMRYKWTN